MDSNVPVIDVLHKPSLHVFQSETDWVIAADEADANAVLVEHYGETLEQLAEQEMLVHRQLADEALLPITNEDGPDGKPERVVMSCAEWAAKEGRSFLGSTEW